MGPSSNIIFSDFFSEGRYEPGLVAIDHAATDFFVALIPWTLNNNFFVQQHGHVANNILWRNDVAPNLWRINKLWSTKKRQSFSVKVFFLIHLFGGWYISTKVESKKTPPFTPPLKHLKQLQRVSCPEKWWQRETRLLSVSEQKACFSGCFGLGEAMTELRIWEIPSTGREKRCKQHHPSDFVY